MLKYIVGLGSMSALFAFLPETLLHQLSFLLAAAVILAMGHFYSIPATTFPACA